MFLYSSTSANSQSEIYIDSLKLVGKYEGYFDIISHVSSKILLELKNNHEYVMVDIFYIGNSRSSKSKIKGTWVLNSDTLILMQNINKKKNKKPELLKYKIINGELWHINHNLDTNNFFVKYTEKKLLTLDSIFSSYHFVIETNKNYKKYHFIFNAIDSALLVTCVVNEKDTVLNHLELKSEIRDSLCLYLKNIKSYEIKYDYTLCLKNKPTESFKLVTVRREKDEVSIYDGTSESLWEIQRMLKNNLK